MPIPQDLKSSKSGFTLIELMVAVSIVAVMASVGLVVYSTAQKTSRISKRVQDLIAVQSAMEVFKTATGHYPVVTMGVDTGWRSECGSWGGHTNNQVIPEGFVPTYMPILPADPSMDKAGNRNCYLYRSNGADYKIMAYQLFDMTNADIFAKPEFVDLRYNNPSYAPAGFPMTFCSGAEGNGDNRGWSLYSDGGKCF